MILSRVVLNPMSREVAQLVRDVQRLHAFVLKRFGDPSASRVDLAVLHRVEVDVRTGALLLVVQSADTPDWSNVPSNLLAPVTPNPIVESVDVSADAFATGTRWRFRLHANTTRKIDTKSEPDGTRRNGRRVPVRGDAARLAWLERHAETAGFALARLDGSDPDVTIREDELGKGVRAQRRLTFAATRFEGTLVVRDSERFASAVRTGIGPSKAYGFGLISVRPCP